MKRVAVVVAIVALAGCSSKFDSKSLRLSWEPPHGVSLESEQAGPPPVAKFSGGIELRSMDGDLPELREETLKPVLAQASARAGLTLPVSIESAKMGTIPAGPVARYTLKTGDSRTLVYLVPGKHRYVLMTLTASEAGYARAETGFERSLATLRLRN